MRVQDGSSTPSAPYTPTNPASRAAIHPVRQKEIPCNKRTITNAKPFANKEGKNRWFAYPRWTKDESAIVYHATPSLYLYTLEDDSTIKVSTDPKADYRYPHCEATPK